jgi:hypothetical protein
VLKAALSNGVDNRNQSPAAQTSAKSAVRRARKNRKILSGDFASFPNRVQSLRDQPSFPAANAVFRRLFEFCK